MVFLRETVWSPSRPRVSPSSSRKISHDKVKQELADDVVAGAAATADTGSPSRNVPKPGRAATVLGKRKVDQQPAESLLHRLAGPSTGKAGLKRDPNEVRQIIYESSRGGHYFKNEERKDELLTAQIQIAMVKLDKALQARGGNVAVEERKADRIIAEQESKRDLSRYICVVDCDAFYASVEELDNPDLVGKAFGVGEGVLTTASYEARKFGCRSAMPGYIAKKLCPHLIFVKLDFTKYTAASKKVMDVLSRYDPELAPASLDEAYMDMTAYIKRTGMTAAAAVQQMREEVKAETGLTVSAGLGPNTMLAKIAADFNKPDGQYIVEPIAAACIAFMQDLSVRKIPGIGRVTERWLESLGVLKCRDIHTLRGKLMVAKGDGGCTGLLRAYLGIGNNRVERGKREDRRGVGHETTFSCIWKPADLDKKLREIADSLAEDLARAQYSGRTLTLKLKLETYEVLSRARSFDAGLEISSADDLYKYGKQLLENEMVARAAAFDDGKPIKGKGRDLRLRLMGLKLSNLRDDSDEVQQKQHRKGTLHDYAQNAKAKPKREDSGPIDLTILDDESDDEDGFEEIFLEAAPCPHCRQTFRYSDDIYGNHVRSCTRAASAAAETEHEIIDLSKSSQPEAPMRVSPRKAPVKAAKRIKHTKTADKGSGNAFAKIMKAGKKRC